MISDKQRELEQTRAANAALIAQAEAKKQDALAIQRTSELDAAQIAQAKADALSEAKMVTISGDGDGKGAAETTATNIANVIQTVLAAQLVTRGGILDSAEKQAPATPNGRK